MDCCWLMKPSERLTVGLDVEGAHADWEPSPISLFFDGKGEARRFMLVNYQQGKTETSFYIDDEALVNLGSFTPYGEARSAWK